MSQSETEDDGRKGFFTRRRLVVIGAIVAVLIAVVAVGFVSKATSNTAACVPISSTTTPPTGATVPNALWWWTMAVSPTDPNTLILTTSAGLYRSADGGKTWAPVGPKNADFTSIVQSGSSLVAGGVATTPTTSPVIGTGLYRTVSNGAPVLVISTDGGKTWKAIHPAGLPKLAIQAMTADPASSSTIYLATNTGKLYRSTNGAKTFTLVTSKLGIPAWALALVSGTQFVGGDMDGGPNTGTGGTAWTVTHYTDLRCQKMVMEYAVQPGSTTTVLMTSIGIVISTDGGKSWHTALKSGVMFGPVAYAPGHSNTAYTVGFDGSIWKSTDGGQTWSPVPK